VFSVVYLIRIDPERILKSLKRDFPMTGSDGFN